MAKKSMVLVLITCISFSSCYKKLYLSSENDVKVLQSNIAHGQYQQGVINGHLKTVELRNDSLQSLVNTLTGNNRNLFTEIGQLRKTEAEEIKAVQDAMIKYFRQVANLAIAQTPPCVNAANGHFRDAMASGSMDILANPNLNLTTNTGIALLAIFRKFSLGNQAAFKNNQNYDPGSWKAFTSWVGDNLVAIGEFFLKVWNFINGGSDEEAAKAAVSAADLYKKQLNDENCHKGRHANGWISVNVNQSAHQALETLYGYNFTDNPDKLGKIILVLTNCFNQLLTLETQGHNPWLKGDWQVGYYGIMSATSWALSKIE